MVHVYVTHLGELLLISFALKLQTMINEIIQITSMALTL